MSTQNCVANSPSLRQTWYFDVGLHVFETNCWRLQRIEEFLKFLFNVLKPKTSLTFLFQRENHAASKASRQRGPKERFWAFSFHFLICLILPGSGLEFGYIDVRDEDEGEEHTLLNHFVLDGNVAHANLLRFALTEQNVESTTVLVRSSPQNWLYYLCLDPKDPSHDLQSLLGTLLLIKWCRCAQAWQLRGTLWSNWRSGFEFSRFASQQASF